MERHAPLAPPPGFCFITRSSNGLSHAGLALSLWLPRPAWRAACDRCVAAVSRHNHRAAARRSARAAVSRARLSPAAQAKTNSMPQGLTRTTLVTVPALVPRCSRRSRLSSVASPRSRPHGGATGRASDTPLRAVRLHILRLSRRGCLRVRFKKVPPGARLRGTQRAERELVNRCDWIVSSRGCSIVYIGKRPAGTRRAHSLLDSTYAHTRYKKNPNPQARLRRQTSLLHHIAVAAGFFRVVAPRKPLDGHVVLDRPSALRQTWLS